MGDEPRDSDDDVPRPKVVVRPRLRPNPAPFPGPKERPRPRRVAEELGEAVVDDQGRVGHRIAPSNPNG